MQFRQTSEPDFIFLSGPLVRKNFDGDVRKRWGVN